MTRSPDDAVCPDCFDAGYYGGREGCPRCKALRATFTDVRSSLDKVRDEIRNPTSVAGKMRVAQQRGQTGMAPKLDAKQALRMLPRDYVTGEAESIPDSRTPEQRAEDEAIRAQSLSEDVKTERLPDGSVRRVITWEGERFAIAPSVGLMPLMEFAYHANSGLDTSDMGALAAMYEMLRDCIYDGVTTPATDENPKPVTEWDRFRDHAKHVKADAESLMDAVSATIELLTAKPTAPESGYSSQSSNTSRSLTDTSSGQREGLTSVADLAASMG